MSTEYFVKRNGFDFRFIKFGNGKKALLCFHGYDRDAEDFLVFENLLGNEFTMYSFDIFYHGKSHIDENISNPTLSKFELCELIQKFMVEQKLNKISLLAYSLGGRIATCILETMPGQIENCFLLAPDGYQNHFWNNFVTRSTLGRFIFKGIVNDPKPFIRFSKLFVTMKFLPEKSFLFLQNYLIDEEHRHRLLKVWFLFKDCTPDTKRVLKCIYRYQITFKFFCGKYDEIIPPKVGIDFCIQIKKKICYVELECGHKILNEHVKISEVILNSIN